MTGSKGFPPFYRACVGRERVRPSLPGAFLAFLALALLLQAPIAFSQEVSDGSASADAAADLKRFFSDVQQLQADFTQREFDADGVFRKESAGRLYLFRPGRFRLDYLQPDELLIWADGKNISMFDKELEQVTVYKQAGRLRESAAALLAGDASVLESYEVKAAEYEGGLQWFDLAIAAADANADAKADSNAADSDAPAEAPAESRMRLALRGSAPAVLEYSDDLGSRVQLLLFRLDFESELDAKLFNPDIPPGVDVFEAAES